MKFFSHLEVVNNIILFLAGNSLCKNKLFISQTQDMKKRKHLLDFSSSFCYAGIFLWKLPMFPPQINSPPLMSNFTMPKAFSLFSSQKAIIPTCEH